MQSCLCKDLYSCFSFSQIAKTGYLQAAAKGKHALHTKDKL
ncbi:hypothetical protein QSI_3462 [Clostridioides difficile P28]|nr:hypothetical protein QSI_3462 [Clostridioides difficile P28]